MDIVGLLNGLPEVLGGTLATIIGLIFLDVTLAVARAVREKEFDLGYLPEFYKTNVAPFIIGYVGVVGAARFVDVSLLPEQFGGVFSEIVTWLGFGTIAAALLRSAYLNGRSLVSGTPRWELEYGVDKPLEE